MGAPAGNQHAAKAKQWTAAIERALERRGNPNIDPDSPIERTPKMKALDELADRFIDAVAYPSNGMQGFKELGDRLEGKVTQPISGADGGDLVVKLVPQDADL